MMLTVLVSSAYIHPYYSRPYLPLHVPYPHFSTLKTCFVCRAKKLADGTAVICICGKTKLLTNVHVEILSALLYVIFSPLSLSLSCSLSQVK